MTYSLTAAPLHVRQTLTTFGHPNHRWWLAHWQRIIDGCRFSVLQTEQRTPNGALHPLMHPLSTGTSSEGMEVSAITTHASGR